MVDGESAGAGLFEVTERPVLEFVAGTDGPVVRRVNPAFERVFGVGRDLVGEPLDAVPLPLGSTGSDGEASILDRARRGQDGNLTLPCETPEGIELFRVRTVTADGRSFLLFSAVKDETPDRQLDVLEQLTHSLRNPLEVAKVHADVAKQTGDLDHLETVAVAHDRIEALIADTIRFARYGTVVEAASDVDVAAVARTAWETVDTGEATLRVGSPGTVVADESRLLELFENLFRNAVRHGRPGEGLDGTGELTVVVDAMPGGFYVADDGTGIPPDERERVLEVGYTTTETGTGLGLAIVTEIAAGHGWTVAVGESDGGGARFDVTGVEFAED